MNPGLIDSDGIDTRVVVARIRISRQGATDSVSSWFDERRPSSGLKVVLTVGHNVNPAQTIYLEKREV